VFQGAQGGVDQPPHPLTPQRPPTQPDHRKENWKKKEENPKSVCRCGCSAIVEINEKKFQTANGMEKSGQKGRPPGGLDRERASPAERDREQEARERHTLPGGVESEPVCVRVCV